MIPINKTVNTRIRPLKALFLLSLFFIFLFSHIDENMTILSQQETITKGLPEEPSTDLKSKLSDNENLNLTYNFNVENLYNYIDSLYDENEGMFLEAVEGYRTTIATYEALSVLRFLGLDYHLFTENNNDWQDSESTIADELDGDDYRDDSGGYLLTPNAQSPSLDGTYGVTTSLWMMNELVLKLKLRTANLLDFVYNKTFDSDTAAFREIGYQNCSIKATFQALTILDLIRKVVIIPELYDVDKTPLVNGTVLDFMTNYSKDISVFLNSKWVTESHFEDSVTPYISPIEDTWYALKSIEILERYGKILGIKMDKNLTEYRSSVIEWLKSQKKTNGVTKGGFGTSDFATVTETGIAFTILNLFNATDEIDSSDSISFIYSSQFLTRENRTYRASELVHLGGFGPNNLTYANKEASKRVNIHDTYFAVLTLLLSGDIFNSIELSLETSHYKDYPEINKTNLIIQGRLATIEQYFTIYNYKSHGSLELQTSVDDWNLTHSQYTEDNPEFQGNPNAVYEVYLQNDSRADFDWSLGAHQISNRISIRNLPVIRSPIMYQNSTLFVGYTSEIEFNPEIIPGDNVTFTIYFQNRSVLTYSNQNITEGSVSGTLISPNKINETWFDMEPINTTTGALLYDWNVSKQALLGTWILILTYHHPDLNFIATISIEVIDTVFFYNISKLDQYYPGEDMDLTVSLKYTNGQFSPNANASIVFASNETQEEVFNLTLKHVQGNNYTTRGSKCPTRYLFGFYNVSILLTWNVSLSFSPILPTQIYNESLPLIQIGGIPTISEATFETDFRKNFDLSENIKIYYGETINLTLKIGFKSGTGLINNVTDENIVIKGGLVNLTQPSTFIQMFKVSQQQESISLYELVNPNLPNASFGIRFQIQSDWNDSYIFLRDSVNIDEYAGYNFSLIGNFVITDVTYLTTEKSEGLYYYALDTTSVLSISFEVKNSDFQNISVPNLNLYGILDIKDNMGTLNQSLPSITSGVNQNGTPIYLLSISTAGLRPDKYEITIYTWKAIIDHLKVGQLLPGFKITKTFSPPPLIQLHEALILVVGLIFIILVYLNLKKYR